MTRETKVGLLVGLGVILLIGIIVSDHLSDSKRQTFDTEFTDFANGAQNSVDSQAAFAPAANQQRQASDSRRAPRVETPIPLPNELPTAAPILKNPPVVVKVKPEQLEGSAVLIPLAKTPAGQVKPKQAPKQIFVRKVTHRVVENESLWQIAHKYYGDGSKWTLIRDANLRKVRKNGQVRVGVDLIIPDAGKTAGSSKITRQVATISQSKYVKVKKGDTLGSIAAKHLGAEKKWEQLYKLNRGLIGSNPDALKIGMRLRIRP